MNNIHILNRLVIYSFKSRYACLINPPYACFASKFCKHSQYLLGLYRMPFPPKQVISYVFLCVYFTAYSYFHGCFPCNSLTPRTFMSLLQLVRYRFSGHVSCVPQQLNSRQSGKLCGHCVELYHYWIEHLVLCTTDKGWTSWCKNMNNPKFRIALSFRLHIIYWWV